MGRKKNPEQKKLQISQKDLLRLIKFGAFLVVAVTAPHALIIFKKCFKDEEETYDYYPSSIKKATTELLRKGFVEISEEDGRPVVKITKEGEMEVLHFDLANMSIKKPEEWDENWWMVVFDIPDNQKRVRDFFRRKLKEMEFFQLQKSVWVFPYSCEKEIKFLREILEIPHYVKIIKVARIENDAELREFFGLK